MRAAWGPRFSEPAPPLEGASDVSEGADNVYALYQECFRGVNHDDSLEVATATIAFTRGVVTMTPHLTSEIQTLMQQSGLNPEDELYLAAESCGQQLREACVNTLTVFEASSEVAFARSEDVRDVTNIKDKIVAAKVCEEEAIRRDVEKLQTQLNASDIKSANLVNKIHESMKEFEKLQASLQDQRSRLQKYVERENDKDMKKLEAHEGATRQRLASERVAAGEDAEEACQAAEAGREHAEHLKSRITWWRTIGRCLKTAGSYGLLAATTLTGLTLAAAAASLAPFDGGISTTVVSGGTLAVASAAAKAIWDQHAKAVAEAEKEAESLKASEAEAIRLLEAAQAACRKQEEVEAEGRRELQALQDRRAQQVSLMANRVAAVKKAKEILEVVKADVGTAREMSAVLKTYVGQLVRLSRDVSHGLSADAAFKRIQEYAKEELSSPRLNAFKNSITHLKEANDRLLHATSQALYEFSK